MARRQRSFFFNNKTGEMKSGGKTLLDASNTDNIAQLKGSTAGNPVALNATGDDTNIDISISPKGSGNVEVLGTLEILTGKRILDSAGTNVEFGDDIHMNSNKITNLGTPTANTDAVTKAYVDTQAAKYLPLTGGTISSNLTVSGNFTVNGTTTTINTSTLSVADNLIDLNSDVTSGTPTENAGIRVLRGDSNAVQLRWNETSDVWEMTTDGSTYQTIGSLASSDTDDLSEGSTNLYYTDARARSAISITDSGGDGSLSYNSSTGVITYTGPSALALAGGTMSGAIAMGTNKITGMGDPAAAQDAATKAYVDSQVSSVPTGDITSVTASTGLTGGGTTGDVTLSIDSTVATLTGTQTLTNKTLTAPVISSITNTGTLTLPTSTGTVALTSDIPTAVSELTNDSGYSTTTGTVTSVAGTGTVNGLTLSGTVTSSGSLTLGGTFSATVSEISDLTATAAELNILDGDTAATSTTLVDADRFVVNDGGTMVQVAASDVATYIGAASNVFKTISVAGQSDVVADSNTDTLTLAAGDGLTITTNAGTDTITFTASSSDSVFSANSDFASVADSVVTSEDLDLVTASTTDTYDLGTIAVQGIVVTTSIVDGNVTTAKIADDAVTSVKLSGLTNSSSGLVSADGDGTFSISAGGSLTDNVTAAGALMDSEVTNLAQVKAFDSSDYATAAQGTLANDALPKSGGAMTGDIDFGQSNKALFGGVGGDLEIYHDGTNAFIDNNDGILYIRNNVDGDDGGDIWIQAKSGESSIIIADDGTVALYYDGIQKIRTESYGVIITGVANISGHVEAIGVEEAVYNLGTTGGTITPNFTNGAIQKITLNANLTFSAFTSPVAGQSITLIINTNGTGRTLTSTMLFAGGNKTMSTNSTTDVMTVLYDGTNYLANYVTNFS